MLNKRPVFIVGFQFGGSNLLQNLLLSHPDLCCTRGELQQLFIGKEGDTRVAISLKRLAYLPFALNEKGHFLSLSKWQERKKFKKSTIKHLDKTLYTDKLKATGVSQNRYKHPNELYSHEEIASSRVTIKLLNGLMFLDENLMQMYPNATFIALIRNGLAVCEGAMRRGVEMQAMAQGYQLGCQHIIKQSQKYSNYHVFRYEDLVRFPVEISAKIYEAASLDANAIKAIRLETKPVTTKTGEHKNSLGTKQKQLIWYDKHNFTKHMRLDINENQIKRLDASHKEVILNYCQKSLQHFSYA